MSRLKDMAAEYRAAAAKLALWLEEQETAGLMTKEKRRCVQEALRGVREVQRLLDGYYDVPRAEGISANGWKARRIHDD